MGRNRGFAGLAALLSFFLSACKSSTTEVEPEPPPASIACGGMGGSVRSQVVTLPQRGGGFLEGKAFAPDPQRQTGPCPLISLLPGGGAGINSVEWAARRLAENGYVVIISKPAMGSSTASYHTAAVSGIDFLVSPANPYRAATDTTAVGVAGWSLGARSLTRTQAEDSRVDALVAWDNLAKSESGDDGSPACTNVPGAIRTPRVPALGQASETCPSKEAEAKKTAFEWWRSHGVPTMQVVFAGSSHFLWSAQAPDADHDLSHHYTVAWFARWLKADTTATERLVARRVNGREISALLSSQFRSAVFLPGKHCPELRAGCE